MGDNSIFGKAVNLFSGLPKGFVALLDAAAPPIYFLLFLLFCAGFPYQFTYHLYHSFSG
uniref:Membrane protein n=1 Tax=Escherichia coli TaxID=562 RepID=A0A3G4RTG0_ECOLX|nr:membrane protein [Escherichia coli]